MTRYNISNDLDDEDLSKQEASLIVENLINSLNNADHGHEITDDHVRTSKIFDQGTDGRYSAFVYFHQNNQLMTLNVHDVDGIEVYQIEQTFISSEEEHNYYTQVWFKVDPEVVE